MSALSFVRTAALLFLWAAAASAQTPAPDAGPADAALALFEQAVRQQEAGELDTAADSYRRFLALQPRNLEALSNLGVVYARLGRYDEAIARYREALQYSRLNPAVRMNLGLAYYKSARYAEAIAEFDEVLLTNPGVAQALLLKSDSLLQLGRYQEAIAILTGLAPAPAEERLHAYLLGMAYLRDGQVERATVQLDRILRDGDSAEAHLLMGLAKRAASDFAGARDEFRQAAARNPELPLAHSLLGQMLLSTGDRDAARAAFLTELKANPTDFESNLYMGLILKEDRQFDEARAYLERAQGVRPGDPGARYQMATLLLGTGETSAALPILEALVAESPSFVEAHVSLATAYYRLQRREDGDRERAIAQRLEAEAQEKRTPSAEPRP